jgi:hypothetical protein
MCTKEITCISSSPDPTVSRVQMQRGPLFPLSLRFAESWIPEAALEVGSTQGPMQHSFTQLAEITHIFYQAFRFSCGICVSVVGRCRKAMWPSLFFLVHRKSDCSVYELFSPQTASSYSRKLFPQKPKYHYSFYSNRNPAQ